jgi:hypothetical protein
MIKDINDLEFVSKVESAPTDDSVTTPSTDDFEPIQMDYNKPTSPNFMGPQGPAKTTITGLEPSFEPSANDSTTPATSETPASEETPAPDQATLDAAFQKYMGSSFNPNSSMDKGKMETVKKALADFQKQNNRPFKIDQEKDANEMRPIMNAAYQSPEYKQAAGVGVKGTASGQGATRSSSAPRQQGTKQGKPLMRKIVGGNLEQMYIDAGDGRFIPADTNVDPRLQLYRRNKVTGPFGLFPRDQYQKVVTNQTRKAIRP